MKNKKIYIMVIGFCFLLTLLLFCIFYKKEDNTNLVDEKKAISKLIENDYLLSVLTYDKPKIGDSTVKTGDITYYYLDNKVKSFDDIDNILKEIYTENIYNEKRNELFKENRFIILDNELYVNPISYCSVKQYSPEDFAIVKREENTLWIEYYGINFNVFKENDVWKLNTSIYECQKEEQSNSN